MLIRMLKWPTRVQGLAERWPGGGTYAGGRALTIRLRDQDSQPGKPEGA